MKITFTKDYIIEVTDDFSPMRKNVFETTKTEELEGRELAMAISKKTAESGLPAHQLATLTKKERFVKKTRYYKRLFNKGDEFKLKKGINVLVGDNGCGKSTLINLFLKENKIKNVLYVDMEKSNPTISKPDPEKGVTYSPEEILNQFMWHSESHGETREGVLKSILTLNFDMLVLDEPEQGLSLKNQNKYFNELKKFGKDMIIVTHSKIFVENSDEVFDVEAMKWTKSKEYLKQIEGDKGHASASGYESISCTLGINYKSKSIKGWIVLVDWRQNKNYKWYINNIYRAKVGRHKICGVKIQPDTWYWFENGILKSKK